MMRILWEGVKRADSGIGLFKSLYLCIFEFVYFCMCVFLYVCIFVCVYFCMRVFVLR